MKVQLLLCFFMSLNVILHISLGGERAIANGAEEGLLFSVNPQVGFQVGFVREVAVAVFERAHIAFVLVVELLVFLQFG